MKMGREEKQKLVDELHGKFSTATIAILTEFNGLAVSEMTELRQKLREAKGELRVVKNTLARRAAEGTGMTATRDAFEGPIAVTFGYADPTAPARILKEFVEKRTEKIKMKIGVVEGQVLDPKGLKRVASLPKKEVLIADLMSRMQSPISGLVGGLQGILRKLVYSVTAIRDKQTTTQSS
ncbi:MAG: 50S ribosomal protein L10 [Nitrospirae bacterium]|nr:50S ribosomal protein L10 [Nitrospirota bacterium]